MASTGGVASRSGADGVSAVWLIDWLVSVNIHSVKPSLHEKGPASFWYSNIEDVTSHQEVDSTIGFLQSHSASSEMFGRFRTSTVFPKTSPVGASSIATIGPSTTIQHMSVYWDLLTSSQYEHSWIALNYYNIYILYIIQAPLTSINHFRW